MNVSGTAQSNAPPATTPRRSRRLAARDANKRILGPSSASASATPAVTTVARRLVEVEENDGAAEVLPESIEYLEATASSLGVDSRSNEASHCLADRSSSPPAGSAHSSRNTFGGRFSLSDFQILRKLGEGGFGEVFMANHTESGYIVALKCVSKFKIKSDTTYMRNIRREVEAHAHLRHDNIVRMYGFFHDDHWLYFILECCVKGDLSQKLYKERVFAEATAAKYFCEVNDALIYCHSRNVIHRDIKPGNVFIALKHGREVLKLADFGFSVHSVSGMRRTGCGTLYYMAPEICKNQVHGMKVDNWSMGVMLYEFLAGYPPFRVLSTNVDDLKREIITGELAYPDSMVLDARDLIYRLMKKKAKNRLPLEDIRNHPFVSRNVRFN